jgi:hypothetical protein
MASETQLFLKTVSVTIEIQPGKSVPKRESSYQL